jgi:tetratricopeptide (TPR) repeat protein
MGVELALLKAMAIRFPTERTLENGAIYDEAYATAMGQVRKDYPEDIDVAVWWAEATLTTMPWDYYYDEASGELKPEAEEVRAVLEAVLDSRSSSSSSSSESSPQKNGQHPLALHLYIHLMEPSPLLRPRAIPAALALRNLTPWSAGHGHLIHMPGHIFLRTPQGLHAASEANQRAIASDREYFSLCPTTTKWSYYKQLYFGHKHAFLLFSSGLEGRKSLAFQTGQQLYSECNIQLVSHVLGGSFLAYPVWPWLAHDLRFGEWGAAEQVEAGREDVPFVQTMQFFVRAFALASQGKCFEAWEEAGRFGGMAGGREGGGEADVFLTKARNLYRVASHSLRARLASAGCFAEQQQQQQRQQYHENAVSEWKRAVAIVDSFPYMEPPLWPLNIQACLGQALLDEGRFEEAEEVYRHDLREWPGNIWSSKGLVLALRGQVEEGGGGGRKEEELRHAQLGFEEAARYVDFELGERSCF